MTFFEMLERNSTRFPEKTALIYEESKISYKTLYEKSMALANFLTHSGLKKGEKVGFLMQKKTPELIISFVGTTAAGGIFFSVDTNQTLDHIQRLFDLTRPQVLIVSDSLQPLLSKLAAPCSTDRIIVIGQKAKQRNQSWDDIILDNNHREKPDVAIQGHDTAYFNITSGTTGVPKCAITTHDNIYWNTLASVESLGLTQEDVHLCMFPVYGHPHELIARPLYIGGTIVLIDSTEPKSIAKAVQDHNVTCLMALGSIYERLIRLHDSAAFSLPSLRLAESGGMHVNPILVQKFQDRFKIPITTVWGSTETTGIALATPPGVYRQSSMGKPCPYYEVKIVDERGTELPPDEIGEMAVRGGAVVPGYFEDIEQTRKSFNDGWFLTGDMVRKDHENYYYFASRQTGMIKVGGLKVFPTEIEELLSTHPKIAEAAVVKRKDRLHGEVHKAVIVPKEGAEIDGKEIRSYCEQMLSKYKVPGIIEFRTGLPKSPGGKIIIREL